jgi:hypothetical protein
MLMTGTVAELLGSALFKLPKLKRVCIAEPYLRPGVKDFMLEKSQGQWTTASKTLLSIILFKARPLETILIEYCGLQLAVHASVLEHTSTYAKQLEAVKILRLNIAGADAGCKKNLCAPAANDTNKSSQHSSARTHYGSNPAKCVVLGRSEPGAWPRLKQSRVLQAAQHACASTPPLGAFIHTSSERRRSTSRHSFA